MIFLEFFDFRLKLKILCDFQRKKKETPELHNDDRSPLD